ncbi:putative surface protein SACOL0050 [Penaeus vannamei]|uniref:putative surface protein SACOL0050 n=1 Tax=Penaeus vannamei TaxID=6689 RepID=UPI00387F4D3D
MSQLVAVNTQKSRMQRIKSMPHHKAVVGHSFLSINLLFENGKKIIFIATIENLYKESHSLLRFRGPGSRQARRWCPRQLYSGWLSLTRLLVGTEKDTAEVDTEKDTAEQQSSIKHVRGVSEAHSLLRFRGPGSRQARRWCPRQLYSGWLSPASWRPRSLTRLLVGTEKDTAEVDTEKDTAEDTAEVDTEKDTAEVDTDTVEVDTDMVEVDTDTAEADTEKDMAEVDTDTVEVDTDTAEADTEKDMAEVDTDTVEVDTDTAEADTDTVEVDTDTAEVDTDTAEADTDTVEVDTDTVEVDTDTAEVDTDTAEADTDTVEVDTEKDTAEEDMATAEVMDMEAVDMAKAMEAVTGMAIKVK